MSRPLLLLILTAATAAAQQGGSAERGAVLFSGKAGCAACHRVGEKGPRTGMDLTEIGSLRDRNVLEKALLDPAREVSAANRLFRVVMNDGTTYTGRLLNQDTSSIQLLDSGDHLRSIPRTGVRQQGFAETPPMPSFKDKLN